ncbi:AzlC family ABC transporter permease [Nocardioides sp.]|uniref:AzlC family ABC transporter permease n=1 Tax=Nocardioides sp. TaxID=35761 RepID=UPI002C60C366|nr:AzlC family ABC transporter permease [Nocardioides sp.]HXH77932.1 AzlC family ABC transporter permease [Nocardioides sp.]
MSQPSLPSTERSGIIRDAVAVGVATGAYGISFGAVAVSSGLSVLQACALSLLVFTGASQFAFVGVVAAGGAPMSGALTAMLLGTRNALYGLRLAPLLQWSGVRRVGAAQILIDESTAMSVNRDTVPAARLGFLATGLSVFVLWNAATLAGALAGTAIGDPRTYGLDAAVGAAFLALLWPRLGVARSQVVAIAAAGVALALVPFTAAGVPVLAAGAVALLGGLLSLPRGDA